MILFPTEISKSLEGFLTIAMFEHRSKRIFGSSDQIVEFGRRDEVAVLDLGLVLKTTGNACDFFEFLDCLQTDEKKED